MKRCLRLLLPLALAMLGCGHSAAIANAAMADMDRVRVAPSAREAAELAPQEYARAEEHRALARKAHQDGDDVAAALYAERAVATYSRAVVLARLARATREATDAGAALAREAERARTLAASRADVEREADELGKKLRIAEEALTPASSGHADAEREAARLVAARALGTQARLLCGAAHLLTPTLPGLAAAEKEATDLDLDLDKSPRPKTSPAAPGALAPIDAAARARASCLSFLTRARRTSDPALSGDADALLSELSASSAWAPSRDDRGVVVSLRGLFKGTALTAEAQKQLGELGRVAAAHPTFAVQVVVHDAARPSATDAAADADRAKAVAEALVAAGAPAGKVKAETAGARAPVVDPADARYRARNARVEVVFVAPGG